MLNDHNKVLNNFEVHHLGLIHEVGSFGMTFKALRQHIFKAFASEINEIKKKEISWCEVDFGLSTNQQLEIDDEFNSYFFMRIVQFYVDNIFVQRTELWLILKTI